MQRSARKGLHTLNSTTSLFAGHSGQMALHTGSFVKSMAMPKNQLLCNLSIPSQQHKQVMYKPEKASCLGQRACKDDTIPGCLVSHHPKNPQELYRSPMAMATHCQGQPDPTQTLRSASSKESCDKRTVSATPCSQTMIIFISHRNVFNKRNRDYSILQSETSICLPPSGCGGGEEMTPLEV